MSKKSKTYGKGFEYEVRDILREATGIQSFERVPTSGAWIGGKNAYKAEFGRNDVTEIMAGDLICPKGWRWNVECKNWDDIPVHQLFMGKESKQINEFLKQVCDSAKVANKEPLLVMKWRKKGYKLPTRVKKLLEDAKVKAPTSNSITVGILVAEMSDKCFDISGMNHIQYTGNLDEDHAATWCFFDFNAWLEYIKDRQY